MLVTLGKTMRADCSLRPLAVRCRLQSDFGASRWLQDDNKPVSACHQWWVNWAK